MSDPSVIRLGGSGRFGLCLACGGQSYCISDTDPSGERTERISACCDVAAAGFDAVLKAMLNQLPPDE